MPSKKSSNRFRLPHLQEIAVYLLILGTLLLVSMTDGLSMPTLFFCLAIAAARIGGFSLSTNAGCALLIAVAAAAPMYWFFFRSVTPLNVKDFLLSIMMVFLLSARSGRDFAAISSYCIWIMMASLFPSSGPQQWILLSILFAWFLVVQSMNELRRNRDQLTGPNDWKGPGGWQLLRPLAGFSVLIVLGVALFAGGLYVLLPRNPIASLHFDFQPFRRLVGFSNAVRLGEIGELQDDRTPAFRVRFLQGTPPPVIRWRGVALPDFNGSAWTNTAETWNELPQRGKIVIASDEQRRKDGKRLYFEIQTLAPMDRVLFSSGVAEYVYLPQGRLRMNSEGALRQISLGNDLPTYSLSGSLGAGGGYESHPVSSDISETMSEERKLLYLRLPRIDPRIPELAETLRATKPERTALNIEAYLRGKYAYSLKSNISGREPLAGFLFVTRAGHCEYFASSMAVMLRTLKIPSRVVTGFYSALPEPVGDWYVIRSSNAHSWVEVWIDGKGWMVFDPTPPGGNRPQVSAAVKWLHRLQDRFLVMSEEWMGGAASLRRPALPSIDFDWRWLALLIVPFLFALPRRGKLPANEASALYGRYLTAAAAKRAIGQTPREIETALAAKGLSAEIRAAYERARFAKDRDALAQLKRLVAQFAQKRV